MIGQIDLAGSFALPRSAMTLNRVGYAAMQLAGRDGNNLAWGPPRDIDAAIAILRDAVAIGVNHIDTAESQKSCNRRPKAPRGEAIQEGLLNRAVRILRPPCLREGVEGIEGIVSITDQRRLISLPDN
jgi:hypothetical protein